MKRKLIFLNLLLLGGTAFAGYKLREQYLADQKHVDEVRRRKWPVVPAAAAVVTPKPSPFTGLPYADVAQKDLFSKDRNPNVVIEVPPPKPVKVMPPLPQVAGVMGLPSGMMALMSERAEVRPHGVHVNEVIGDFKVIGITPQVISFEWDGKRVDKRVEELLARAPVPVPAPGGASGAFGTPGNLVPAGPPAPAKPSTITIGNAMKACTPGDTSPAGTVADGYKKVVEATPFGDACRWLQVQ